ncbi:two-component sensor histidine kinase [Alteribacter lacisalsi]|uniref:Sensor histidine kinase n=1 Tax=Alteribacter lacisalsi TaxID=2045244 RepID=A0A2W0H2Y7_9BACI|nr:sensor histidine kinase [Alteribacter lacisalsi]PYZ95577.1 two-component sensor histidine kinase [Alteribacter lacisalsi]
MNVMFRTGLITFTAAMVFSLVVSVTIFFSFPLESWSMLWEQRVFDLPFIYFLLTVTVLAGITAGLLAGSYSKNKLTAIRNQVEAVSKGKKRTGLEEEPLLELKEIEKSLTALEHKIAEQTKTAQRLVTEHASERERSLQEVVAEERTRLARELHDSVSQQLFAASMMMATINETRPPEDDTMKKQLAMVGRMIEQSQLEMRALLLHLRPVALKNKTLEEGVKELLSELKEKVPLKIQVKAEPLELEKGVEDHLFRILQEAVSNILRHAKADKMTVLCVSRDDYVILRVTDNGIGFDVDKAAEKSSYGLTNMKERAEAIGGDLKIVSVAGEGSYYEVKVPYAKGGERK